MVNDEIALNLLYSQVFEIENYSILFSFPSYGVEESEQLKKRDRFESLFAALGFFRASTSYQRTHIKFMLS